MVILVMILVFACILIIILEGYLTDTEHDTKPIKKIVTKLAREELDTLHKKKIEEIHSVINRTKPSSANKTKEETNSEKLENTSMCWLNEDHLIIQECSSCADYDKPLDKHLSLLSQAACMNTGYRELVRCKFSGEVYRSCIALNDSHSFWTFQFFALLSSLTGYCLLRVRTKQLDRKMLERLRRQLQSGA